MRKILKRTEKKLYCTAINQKKSGIIADKTDFEAKCNCWTLGLCSIKVMGDKVYS